MKYKALLIIGAVLATTWGVFAAQNPHVLVEMTRNGTSGFRLAVFVVNILGLWLAPALGVYVAEKIGKLRRYD